MRLLFDWMISFSYYGFSSPLLFMGLPLQMAPSNIVTHSLKQLFSFSKYLSSAYYVLGTMLGARLAQTRLIMPLPCMPSTKVAGKCLIYFDSISFYSILTDLDLHNKIITNIISVAIFN